MIGEELWIHLNYHIIHHLDFLPIAEWSNTASDGMFQSFIALYNLLVKKGKLAARVEMDACGIGADGVKITLRDVMSWASALPDSELKKKKSTEMTHQYSAMIDFDLDFKVHLSSPL